MNLLNSQFFIIGTVMLIVFAVIFALTIVLMLVMIRNKSRQHSRHLAKTPDIDYTQILSSGGGTSGSVMMHGGDGGMGSFSSAPVTKFLVVYLDGANEIVTVNDGSELCKIYLSKLRQN